MAILRAKDIRKLPKTEKDKKLNELRKELMKLRSQMATGTNPENPGKIRAIRRTIAKILTLNRVGGCSKKQ